MPDKNQSLTLINKNILTIKGIENVISITENEANIIVCGEVLNIKGTNLTADKLSLEQGEIVILGNITSLKYEQKKEGITLPKCCVILEKMGRYSHYLVYFDGKGYDSNLGVLDHYDVTKIKGYLEICV